VNARQLLSAASEARERAYAPFSGYLVGAALLAADGRVFSGCNIENRTYGLALCAERTAVATAVAAGAQKFTAIAIVADSSPPARPCGLCRETLAEFCGPDFQIHLGNLDGERFDTTLGDLFPDPFVFSAQGGERR